MFCVYVYNMYVYTFAAAKQINNVWSDVYYQGKTGRQLSYFPQYPELNIIQIKL